MNTMMMMEVNPIEYVGFTAVAFAISLALATGIIVGVVTGKYGSPLSYSFAGILSAGTFGFGLTPWIILGQNVHLSHLLNSALLVLGLIIVALLVRIHRLVTKKPHKLPVADYLPEQEVQRQLSTFLAGQSAALVSPAK